MSTIKVLAVLGVAGWMIFGNHAQAQIPVTDGASIAKNAAEFALNAKRCAEQVEQLKTQIDQAKQQYESMTGSRALGEILNNPALRDYLPGDWQAVYDAVKNGGYEGLSGTAKTVYDDNKVYNACQFFPEDQQRLACEAAAVKGAQDKGFALDAYEKAKSRIEQIDQLMAKINDTPDPKAIAELQGRIAAEQANIQNEQTKLQMYQMVAAAEDRVQQQRQKEIDAKVLDKREYKTRQPANMLNQ